METPLKLKLFDFPLSILYGIHWFLIQLNFLDRVNVEQRFMEYRTVFHTEFSSRVQLY